nr:membralin-like protein At1g60995 isoform X3 [Arachis hypogaea]
MWFVSPLALVSLSSCCPSKHALLVPKEEDCIEWFKNAGFKDVKLKRIGPKWYHGGFKVRHGQVHPSVHISLWLFAVQLQHHARHRLPTFQLIFVHVIESLVFVPFYDDQLLAFMVLILIWLCELFTLISVRTPISIKFFPRFFLLYFLVFHIYFFFYSYGFSYLALSTTAAFMQHLILYFWNRFEVRNDKGWKELQSGKRPFLTG